MKTIAEYFNELPEDIRNKAFANLEVESSEVVEDAADAIYEGFAWTKTPEGGNFWVEVYKSLKFK